MLDNELLQLIEQYVVGAIPTADFSLRFAGVYFAVRQQDSERSLASVLCDFVIGPLAEFSRGHRSEESLREALGSILRSVVREVAHTLQPRSGSVSTPQEIAVQWGEPSYEIQSSAIATSVSVPEMLVFSHA